MRPRKIKVLKIDLELGLFDLDTLLGARDDPADADDEWLWVVQDAEDEL